MNLQIVNSKVLRNMRCSKNCKKIIVPAQWHSKHWYRLQVPKFKNRRDIVKFVRQIFVPGECFSKVR